MAVRDAASITELKFKDDDEKHADDNIPPNYVQHTLTTVKPLPPIQWKNILNEINWVSFLALTVVPILAIYG